jgi:phenol 2-monooxygenase
VADLPSPFLPHTITQGRIERFLLDAIEGLSDSALQIERGTEVTSFDYEPSLESAANSHPLKLTLRTLSGDEADPLPAPGAFGGRNIVAEGNMPRDELSRVIRRQGTPGSIEIVKAKYLIGCDGAHSWLRTQLGFKVLGASTDSVWYEAAGMRYSVIRNLTILGARWTLFQ